MKKYLLIIALVVFSVGFMSASAIATMTIVTHADPSLDSSNPMFSVDFLNSSLIGGWADTKTGLTLEIPYNGHSFSNAWFDMTPVSIGLLGTTGSGTINFYADNTSTPLVTITFQSGSVSRFGYGADDLFVANGVTITGPEITDVLSDEEFAFSFANKKKLSGDAGTAGGFTATAAFTSSATIPEPATIALFSMSVFGLIRGKKRK